MKIFLKKKVVFLTLLFRNFDDFPIALRGFENETFPPRVRSTVRL